MYLYAYFLLYNFKSILLLARKDRNFAFMPSVIYDLPYIGG
jgi:hypothetical protein